MNEEKIFLARNTAESFVFVTKNQELSFIMHLDRWQKEILHLLITETVLFLEFFKNYVTTPTHDSIENRLTDVQTEGSGFIFVEKSNIQM